MNVNVYQMVYFSFKIFHNIKPFNLCHVVIGDVLFIEACLSPNVTNVSPLLYRKE